MLLVQRPDVTVVAQSNFKWNGHPSKWKEGCVDLAKKLDFHQLVWNLCVHFNGENLIQAIGHAKRG